MKRTANMNLKVIIGVLAAVTLAVAVNQPQGFRATFKKRCKVFQGNNKPTCEQVLNVFEQAYVGKPSCDVSVSDYEPLMKAAPFTHSCSKTMLWSKTAKVVHEYTRKNKDCFAMENTLLGYCLDGLEWCGKKGSSETFTSGCPKWGDCENNPVRSFWTKASTAFADYACGEVTVMLDGSQAKPFDPNSVFARIEIKGLRVPQVTRLIVILVAGGKSNCNSPNLHVDLRKALNRKIDYVCKELQKSQIDKCSTVKNMGCAACLLNAVD